MARRFLGSRPLKRVTVRIFPKKGEGKEDQYTYRAPGGRFYTEANLETLVEKMVDFIDAKYPAWEFRMVEVGEGRFNFVYDRDRNNEELAEALKRREEKKSGTDDAGADSSQ